MMKGLINNISVATFSAEDENTRFSGVANSNQMTRNGTYLAESENEHIAGQRVPLLENHEWDTMPVGYANFSIGEDGLHYDAVLFKTAPNYNLIVNAIEAGVMSVSIGFMYDKISKDGALEDVEMLELSLTAIPADANATAHFSLEKEKEQYAMQDDQLQTILDAISALDKKIDDVIKLVTPATDGDADKQPADDQKKDEAMSILKEMMSVADMPLLDRMKFNKQIKSLED